MPTNVLTVEIGQEVVVTSTTVNDAGSPTDPATCKFYLEEPDGAGPGPGSDADTNGSVGSGVRIKYYTLTKRGTYGVTVRTTAPVTVKSIHITSDWTAA